MAGVTNASSTSRPMEKDWGGPSLTATVSVPPTSTARSPQQPASLKVIAAWLPARRIGSGRPSGAARELELLACGGRAAGAAGGSGLP